MIKIAKVHLMTNTDEIIEIENQDELNLAVRPIHMENDINVRIAKEQSSVFELLRREKRGDLVLAPDFQRNDIWDLKHKSELIESILMGFPIPLIYLFENENGIRQVVDGKQRITALKMFLNNEFALTSLSMLPDLKGKIFDDIRPLSQAKLEDYQLHTYVIQPPTPEFVKFNIFERVNRSGISINKQEMRHALYQGKITDLLQELAESEAFKLCTDHGVKPDRMRDRYLVLRFIAFYLLKAKKTPTTNIEFKSDIDSFLAATMTYLNEKASDELIQHIKQACFQGMNNTYQIIGDQACRFNTKESAHKRPINMGLFEMLVFAFSHIEFDTVNIKEAKNLIKEKKAYLDEQGTFGSTIDTIEHVTMRFNTALEITEGLNNA